MEAHDPATGEVIELHPEQEALFGGFQAVEEYELSIVGASGLECGDELALGQDVQLTIRGHVRSITQEIRTRPEKEGGAEYLVRVAKIKALGAKVTRTR